MALFLYWERRVVILVNNSVSIILVTQLRKDCDVDLANVCELLLVGFVTVCTNNTYGTNCSSQCLCNLANTVSCDPVTGTCRCKSGWTSPTCGVDADECSASISPCTGANEVCQNTDGGYTCLCKAGYYRDAASTCSGMDFSMFDFCFCEFHSLGKSLTWRTMNEKNRLSSCLMKETF